MTADLQYLRTVALEHATQLHATELFPETADNNPDGLDAAHSELLHTADRLYLWLLGTTHIQIDTWTVVDQTTHQPTGTNPGRNPMQLHDNEQVDLTVRTLDAKGFETVDPVEWSVDDPNVAHLLGATDSDTHTTTLVAGNPGSTVVRVSVGELSATMAVDVIPGDVAKIEIAAGDPVDQPPAVPGDGGEEPGEPEPEQPAEPTP